MTSNLKNKQGDMLVISVCFFLSGMCGLIYQVLWTKMLGLVFGHTTLAISTVVTAFLAGLALGSFILGRIADKKDNPFQKLSSLGGPWQITSYCVMEITIGVFCFLTPWLFKLVEVIYLQCVDWSPFSLNLLRFLLCAIVMIIPTMAMGATLPLISKFLISTNREVGEKLGFIYSINTAGSVLGTFLAGFVLIPNAGISSTLLCAAILNVGIGIFLLSYGRGMQTDSPPETGQKIVEAVVDEAKEKDAAPVAAQPRNAIISVFVVVFAMSGFASLVYELAWNRSLALALGSSTYAFSAMLATFLFGTALGSYIFSKMSKTRDFDFGSFAINQFFIGISSVISVMLLGLLPIIFGKLLNYISSSYNLVIVTDFILCFLAMILPTTLIGISFPLAGKLYTNKIENLGKSIGDIYAINTIGSVSGSFLTGFVLMPWIGVQHTIFIAVCFNMIGALLLILLSSGNARVKVSWAVVIVACILSVFFIPKWDNRVMASGLFRGKGYNDTGRFATEDVVYYKDGISCSVAVIKSGESISLKVNGKADASNAADMSSQILVGYLPIFYHKDPQSVFLLGLGSGVTAGAVLDHPAVKNLECVEIEPATMDAAAFFSKYNRNALADSRLKMHVGDGRNRLLSSKKKYDVIISEPSNPWISGVASLFSKEYFELCKSRLNDDGVACIWLQLYSISPEDVKMILTTVSSVFPEMDLWLSYSDCIIVCSEKPLFFKYDQYRKVADNSSTFKDYKPFLKINHPDEFFSYYLTNRASIIPLTIGNRVNTDDLLFLEYSAPVSLYNDSALTNLDGLFRYKTSFSPSFEGNVDLSPDFYSSAYDVCKSYVPSFADSLVEEGLKRYKNESKLNICTVDSLINAKKIPQAEARLDSLIKSEPENPQYLRFKADREYEISRYSQAELFYEKLYNLKAMDSIVFIKYLTALHRTGQYEKMLELSDAALKMYPEGSDIFNFTKLEALYALGRIEEAAVCADLIVHKQSPLVFERIFECYMKLDQKQKAFEVAWQYYCFSGSSVKSAELLIDVLEKLGRREEARAIAINELSKSPFNKLFLNTIYKNN